MAGAYSFQDVLDLGFAFLFVFGGFGGNVGACGELRIGVEQSFCLGMIGFDIPHSRCSRVSVYLRF